MEFMTSKAMRSKFVSMLIAALFLLGCDRSGPPVHFILPQGFRGVFQLSLDKQNGNPITKSNGTLVITVPTNASITVKYDEFLSHWHSETASYPDGTLIKSEVFDTNAVSLFALSSSGHNFFWLVGTFREYGIANSLTTAPKMPLARPLTDADRPVYGTKN
jgi:hypothetical protein